MRDISYDEAVLQKSANQLYARARSMVASATFLGLLLGGVAGFVGGASAGADQGVVLLIGALVGALFGYVLGQSRAFTLRVQAQTLLVQMQIERNTRSRAPIAVSTAV